MTHSWQAPPVLERAEFPVHPGHEAEFEEAMIEGLTILAGADGCRSATCARGVENASTYLLLLEWTTVEAHIKFRRTAAFDRFRALASPFFAGASNLAHFQAFARCAQPDNDEGETMWAD